MRITAMLPSLGQFRARRLGVLEERRIGGLMMGAVVLHVRLGFGLRRMFRRVRHVAGVRRQPGNGQDEAQREQKRTV